MLKRRQTKAQAAMEYIFVITLIIISLMVFQKYITRGFVGRWKGAGDAFSDGRQYDPNSTQACAWDFQFTNTWYDQNCYEANDCARPCKTIYFDQGQCEACISGCPNPQCVTTTP